MPPQIIPPVLQPYIQDCITSHPSKTLITSVLDAQANWLILRFIAASLKGTTHHDENRHIRSTILDREIKTSTSQPAVIFLSCFRPPSLWIELGKKIGLDFISLTTSKRLAYIDGLAATIPSGGNNNSTDNKLNTIRLRSLGLQDVKNAITTARQSLPSSVTTTTPTATTTNSVNDVDHRKITIIIDGLDFLLASSPTQNPQDNNNLSTSLNQLTQFINSLHDDDNSNIILSVSADSPLIHSVDAGTELEVGHGIFTRMLAYQCRWVYQTRSLETGRARDVDGVVRVSRGGLFEGVGEARGDREKELEDGEWLYQVKGDGSVRVWLRGE